MIYYWSVRNNISQVTSKYLSLNLQNLFLFNSKHQKISYLLLSQSNLIQRTPGNRGPWTKGSGLRAQTLCRPEMIDIWAQWLYRMKLGRVVGKIKQLESFIFEHPFWFFQRLFPTCQTMVVQPNLVLKLVYKVTYRSFEVIWPIS